MILLQSFNYRVLDFFHDAPQPDTSRAIALSFLHQLNELKADLEQGDYMASCGRLNANLLFMDMLSTESWLLEVALEGEPWFYFHPCSPPTSSVDMALSHRTALLWKRVDNNKAFIQRLQEIPEAAFPNMVFAVYSWLCALFNSHMRAAARLFQDVADHERNNKGQQPSDTSFQQLEAQIVATRVDFSAASATLLQAFEGAWGRNRDTFSEETELGRLRRGMELASHCFEKKIRTFTDGGGDSTAQNDDGLDSRPTNGIRGTVEDVVPAHPYSDGWALPGEPTTPGLRMIIPDEDFWNSFMNDFSQPYN